MSTKLEELKRLESAAMDKPAGLKAEFRAFRVTKQRDKARDAAMPAMIDAMGEQQNIAGMERIGDMTFPDAVRLLFALRARAVAIVAKFENRPPLPPEKPSDA